MADDKYNTGNFSQDGNGGIWGKSDVEGSASDFESWDWKQIKAAVNGNAAVLPGTPDVRADAIASPLSLLKAAEKFEKAQLTLNAIAVRLTRQGEALAGEDGPWSGKAATGFRNMLDLFAAQLSARADQIGGGASASNPVPRQLWDSGQHLLWAQHQLQALDVYYADWAKALGAPVVDGLVYVSTQPALVMQMTEQMRKVVRMLAAKYSVTVSDIVPPDASAFTDKPSIDENNPNNGLGDNKGNEFKVPQIGRAHV